MKLTFARAHLARHTKTWASGLEMSDPYAFELLESFKYPPKQTFDPPRDDFTAQSELLKFKQDERDVHLVELHIRLLASSITADPVHDTR